MTMGQFKTQNAMKKSGKKRRNRICKSQIGCQDKYERAIIKHGVLALLYVLKEYEDDQWYEECKKIYDAIIATNIREGWHLPTRYGKEAIEFTLHTFEKYELVAELYLENIESYAREIKRSK